MDAQRRGLWWHATLRQPYDGSTALRPNHFATHDDAARALLVATNAKKDPEV